MLEMPLFPACIPVPMLSTGETLWGALSRAARVAQWPTQMCHLGPAPKALANLETPSPPPSPTYIISLTFLSTPFTGQETGLEEPRPWLLSPLSTLPPCDVLPDFTASKTPSRTFHCCFCSCPF